MVEWVGNENDLSKENIWEETRQKERQATVLKIGIEWKLQGKKNGTHHLIILYEIVIHRVDGEGLVPGQWPGARARAQAHQGLTLKVAPDTRDPAIPTWKRPKQCSFDTEHQRLDTFTNRQRPRFSTYRLLK